MDEQRIEEIERHAERCSQLGFGLSWPGQVHDLIAALREARAEAAEERVGLENACRGYVSACNSLEVAKMERDAARAALQALRDEISEPTFEDDRCPYVEVQISRETWLELKAEREARRG